MTSQLENFSLRIKEKKQKQTLPTAGIYLFSIQFLCLKQYLKYMYYSINL